jgi:hypothetical protein
MGDKMSYSVFVSSPLAAVIAKCGDRSKVDEDKVEGDTYFYLNEAIASSIDIHDYWIGPSARLGLYLLKNIGS